MSLDDPQAMDPALCGGKASTLSRLLREGFPVPEGFVITTVSFRLALDPDQGATVEPCVSAELATAVANAYDTLGGSEVAVRSSASGEDSAERSFAGQYLTRLGVATLPALLAALADCWRSLHEAGVSAYRSREVIAIGAESAPAMAVIVQRMVAADCSGVLFTADPVSGSRRRMVVEATPGLGDALMAGRAEPHRYVAERLISEEEDEADEPAWSIGLVHLPAGAEVTAVPSAAVASALSLGRRVASAFDVPQDVEWAWTQGVAYLLQSRPITTIYPAPVGARSYSAESGPGGTGTRLFLSFAAIQGLLDPMTPLGRDTIRGLFSGAAGLFGLRVTWRDEPVMATAGDRLWLDVGGLAESALGRRVLLGALRLLEPGIGDAVRTALAESPPRRGGPRWTSLWRLAPVAATMLARAAAALVAPVWSRRRAEDWLRHLAGSSEKPNRADVGRQESSFDAPLEQLADVWRRAFPTLIPHVIPRVVAAVACQRLLARLTRGVPGVEQAELVAGRGLPGNPTTAMNRELWQIAQQARAIPEGRATLGEMGPEELADRFLDGALPSQMQQAMETFLAAYGARGEAEIDLGRRRWREDPTPLFQTLHGYLKRPPGSAPPPGVDPDRDERELEERAASWERALAGRRLGSLRCRLLRRALHRFRTLGGLREAPKLAVMRLLGPVRWSLLEAAKEFVARGVLTESPDVFLLHVDELERLAAGMTFPADASGETASWRSLVGERRAIRRREFSRRRVPLVLHGDGEALYASAPPSDGQALRGTPVSPGVVVGTVRVMMSPSDGVLEPGEVLVCRATDPAWTPLFLTASALVTEVGGLMTHGSVVAREHGIPAVVGVVGATEHLRTGERVRVDGGTGRVEWTDRKGPTRPAG